MALLKQTAALVLGLGISAIAPAAKAEPPGVYYSWRALDTDVTECLDRAGQALASQSLADIQTEGNSVAGRTEETTAVFVCLEEAPSSAEVDPQASPQTSTVMVIVASSSDEAALALREALKVAF